MGELFEELSKDLARGMSRRQALWRFAAGFGAVVGALFTGRSAEAQGRGNAVCVEFCRAQGVTGREFGECVARSAQCPPGDCAMMVNGHFHGCVPVDQDDVCVEFCREQGLTGGELDECVAQSAQCPRGHCALMTNGRFSTCVRV